MRHSRLFRLMAALFGVWFTFTLVQPNGLSGMMMSGSGASMTMAMSGTSANVSSMNTRVADTDLSMDMSPMATHDGSTRDAAANDGPTQSNKPAQCDQHDCCCSALSPVSLMPVATLSWLPEHVVKQAAPRTNDRVVHTDGQLRLPFANGPPRTVSA